MDNHIRYIRTLVQKGGPDSSEYGELNEWFRNIGIQTKQGIIDRKQIRKLWKEFGEAFSIHTMQGFVARKPHGYAGDFEIIDKIYTHWISDYQHLHKWDMFFHSQKATEAVRNRKNYFIDLMKKTDLIQQEKLKVLNVGCGPSREIKEYLDVNPDTNTIFDCVDSDQNAILYAKSLCNGIAGHINFHNRNIFRFKNNKKYDLIWSAGLFDYLNDKSFKFLLQHLLRMVDSGGHLIIGNFSRVNPSRHYMEFGEWFLNHRYENNLQSLAIDCGVEPKFIQVDSESEGINLFLKIHKP